MKFKKVLAVLMTSALIMGMSMTTFAKSPGADNVYGTSDDFGTITVNGITAEEGLTVTAYPIVKADYDETTNNFEGYTSLYPNIITDVEDIDQEDLNSIISQIKEEYGRYPMSIPSGGDGTSYTADVPVGAYLVMITGAETKVYNPVVVSVDYENNQGSNDLGEGTVTLTDDNAWVKVSNVPTIDKVIVEGQDESKGNSVDIGDSVNYEVTISPVPNYGGEHPVLNVVDTLSVGLSYNDDLSVKLIGAGADGSDVPLVLGTDYTLTPGTNEEGLVTLTVDFVVNGNYTLNSYAGKEVVITYSAKVTENALVNEDGNGNDVDLNYTTDSKTTGNDGKDEDKTYTYTFDIDGETTGDIVTKVGEDQYKNALPDAVFGLYTDSKCTKLYTNDKFDTGYVTSDGEGQLYISGLEEGTYYLKETQAPEGYSLNTEVFKIDIAAVYNEDGTLKSWTIKINDTATSTFNVSHDSGTPVVEDDIQGTDIQNTKLSSLPSTGGIGTTIFTIGGCVIMITAAGLYFASRRRHENK